MIPPHISWPWGFFWFFDELCSSIRSRDIHREGGVFKKNYKSCFFKISKNSWNIKNYILKKRYIPNYKLIVQKLSGLLYLKHNPKFGAEICAKDLREKISHRLFLELLLIRTEAVRYHEENGHCKWSVKGTNFFPHLKCL